MRLSELVRGLMRAPVFSLRQRAVGYSLAGTVLVVGAAVSGATVGAIVIAGCRDRS